jgi:hypothetical protein
MEKDSREKHSLYKEWYEEKHSLYKEWYEISGKGYSYLDPSVI